MKIRTKPQIQRGNEEQDPLGLAANFHATRNAIEKCSHGGMQPDERK